MKQWHYAEGGKPSGSFATSEIEEFFHSGKLDGDSLIWADGMAQWQTLRDTEEFTHLLQRKMPPPLPPIVNAKAIDAIGAPEVVPQQIAPVAEPVDHDEDISVVREPSIRFEPAGPWSRYFARQFDLSVLSTALVVAASFATAYSSPRLFFQLNSLDARVLFLLFLPAAHIVNAAIITMFGNTMGKAMFGIKAVPISRTKRLPLSGNIGRELRVWVYGLAFGIPLVCLFTMVPAYKNVSKGQRTSYDEGITNVLSFSSSKIRRAVAMLISLGILLAITASNSIEKQAQSKAAQSYSWTNPETSMKTTIPGGWQYEKVAGPEGGTLYGFTNTKTGVVALLAREQIPDQTISSYATILAKALSDTMPLEPWAMSELPNVWMADGALKSGNHPARIYVTEVGKAFWRVVLVNQIDSKAISEPEITRALLSSTGLQIYQ